MDTVWIKWDQLITEVFLSDYDNALQFLKYHGLIQKNGSLSFLAIEKGFAKYQQYWAVWNKEKIHTFVHLSWENAHVDVLGYPNAEKFTAQ